MRLSESQRCHPRLRHPTAGSAAPLYNMAAFTQWPKWISKFDVGSWFYSRDSLVMLGWMLRHRLSCKASMPFLLASDGSRHGGCMFVLRGMLAFIRDFQVFPVRCNRRCGKKRDFHGYSASSTPARRSSSSLAFTEAMRLHVARRGTRRWILFWFRDLQGSPGNPSGSFMSPGTSLNFLLIGCALLLAPKSRSFGVFQIILILSAIISWLGFSRYLYGGDPLFPLAKMAAHTALAFPTF